MHKASDESTSGVNDTAGDETETSKITSTNLNTKQKIILDRIGQQVKWLRIQIMEIAGTGKSYLIKAIRERLQTMSRNGKSPVIVIAPIGVATFNINGATIH